MTYIISVLDESAKTVAQLLNKLEKAQTHIPKIKQAKYEMYDNYSQRRKKIC